MESFNNKLEVGQPAMIIGCRKEMSRPYIGTTVIVEEFLNNPTDVTEHYVNPPRRVLCDRPVVRVSGYKGQSCTDCGTQAKAGVGFFSARNLMPLPPLEEKEVEKEKELDLV